MIYEELHPETKHGGDRKSDQVAEGATCSFTAATAYATGKAERTIRAATTRGKRLGSDLDELVGTSLDNTQELDALGRMAPEERRPLIDRAKAGERVTAARPAGILYAMLGGKQEAIMPEPAELQKLKDELEDKEAMLRGIETGKFPLGNPWENRDGDLRRRIAELKVMVEAIKARSAPPRP